MRGTVQSIGPYTQLEVRKTVSGLAAHLNLIFAHGEEKKTEEVRAMRIALSNAHSEEINALEARFVQQIELQAAAHSVELDKVHSEMMRKTEDALGWSQYAESSARENESKENARMDADGIAYDSFSEGDEDSLQSHARSTSGARSVSFAADIASSINKHRRVSTTTTTTTSSASMSATASVPSRRGSFGAAPLSAPAGKPAYQSVLTGVLEALTVEDILAPTSSQQIVSLAKAHQEPSFAAQAAAKSLLAGHLERFLNALLERTSAAAIAASSSSPNGTTNNSIVPGRSYTGTNYNIFFDS